jgi:FdhD protein
MLSMNTRQNHIPGVTRLYPVIKSDGTGIAETTVEVCTESRVILFLNDIIIGDLSVTPVDLEAFAIGYLICEGYICFVQNISDINITLPEIRVTASCPDGNPVCGRFSKNSSGGSCRDLLPDRSVSPLPDGIILSADTILSSMDRVNDYSVIWKRTGGMHCSLIIRQDGEVICGVEDMGRHTTVDKAVGIALQKGIDLSRCFLVCSGRLPVDMVAKAFRAGIPVMISNNAAFAGGIEFAIRANMTLAGFVRPPAMTIYTGAQRISFQEKTR